jgi:hypothetical protein
MMGEKSLFNKCCWENWVSARRKLKLDLFLSLSTNINSKWIKGLNRRLKTLELVQGTVRSTLELIGRNNNFLNSIPVSQQPSEKTDKWHCTKLLHSKRIGHQIEQAAHRMGENLC